MLYLMYFSFGKKKRVPRMRPSIGKGKNLWFLKSEKISKKSKNSAAYAAERPLFLDSFLEPKIRGL